MFIKKWRWCSNAIPKFSPRSIFEERRCCHMNRRFIDVFLYSYVVRKVIRSLPCTNGIFLDNRTKSCHRHFCCIYFLLLEFGAKKYALTKDWGATIIQRLLHLYKSTLNAQKIGKIWQIRNIILLPFSLDWNVTLRATLSGLHITSKSSLYEWASHLSPLYTNKPCSILSATKRNWTKFTYLTTLC